MNDKITINDFGFSLTTEENIKRTELDKINLLNQEKDDKISKYQLKLKRVKDEIWPLLERLKKDPHLEIIKWPNRVYVINNLMQKIESIILE